MNSEPSQLNPAEAVVNTVRKTQRHVTRRVASILTLVLLNAACRAPAKPHDHAPGSASSPPSAPSVRTSSSATPEPSASVKFPLLDHLTHCDVDQLGPALEVGTDAAQARGGFNAFPGRADQLVERNGDTFTRVYDNLLSYSLWLDEPIERPRVAIRLVGLAATRVTVRLDKAVVGTTKLTRGELITRSYPALEGILEPGRHTVTVEFRGKPRDRDEPNAEVDWIHLGQPLDADAVATVPTLRNLVADQNIGGIPKRAVVLRAPSSVRCPLLVTAPSHLEVSVGFWGGGHGLAEVRILEDNQAPVTLRQQKTQGGNGASWTPLNLDLSPYANRIVHLELRALRASQQGRVAFGEPKIVRSELPHPPQFERPKLVLVVVASGLWRRKIPPWGPVGNFAGLSHLTRNAVVFQNYQASSTVPAAAMASLITGLGPASHTLEDPFSRLPASVATLQQAVKQSSGRTAMFTGVPSTFAAFGFASNWDEYQSVSPVKDLPASEPITLATRWLQQELETAANVPRFVLIHTRGMHPPWDLTKDELGALQPQEYGGPIDARRGGITLARIRKQLLKSQRRLNDEDWVRIEALTNSAFNDQSQALDQLANLLKRFGILDSSMVVFMGDVGAGEPPSIPFDPVGSLRNDQLIAPLLIKFPGNLFPSRSVDRPVTTVDVTRTVLGAFGLEPLEGTVADDLAQVAAGRASLMARPLVASFGNHYASRLANWQLSGELGKEPSLCELYVDPACTTNRYGDRALTSKAAWLFTRDEIIRMKSLKGAPPREPASIDPDTAAALTVWGDLDQ